MEERKDEGRKYEQGSKQGVNFNGHEISRYLSRVISFPRFHWLQSVLSPLS